MMDAHSSSQLKKKTEIRPIILGVVQQSSGNHVQSPWITNHRTSLVQTCTSAHTAIFLQFPRICLCAHTQGCRKLMQNGLIRWTPRLCPNTNVCLFINRISPPGSRGTTPNSEQDSQRAYNVTMWCNGHATTLSVYCWATCHCHQYKNLECWTTMVLWWRHIAQNNTPYLGLPVKCPKFLSDCNKIWTLSTDFHISPPTSTEVHISPPTSNSTAIRPVGAALIHSDRRKRGS